MVERSNAGWTWQICNGRPSAVEEVPQMTDDPHDAMMLPYTARPRSTKAATPSPWPALVGAVVMLGLLTLVL